jgi:prepilin-type processing-associated H-X9-DG protein
MWIVLVSELPILRCNALLLLSETDFLFFLPNPFPHFAHVRRVLAPPGGKSNFSFSDGSVPEAPRTTNQRVRGRQVNDVCVFFLASTPFFARWASC